MAAGDVSVHLFEWKWTDIAAECENVLGPAGVRAVQISPPQEHSLEPPNYPWSERYQPVSYSVARSRSGTGAELADMINRCDAAGVEIIADAVINHMTNFRVRGSAATEPATPSTAIQDSIPNLIFTLLARSTTTRARRASRTASCFRCPICTPGWPRCGRRSPTI